MNPITDILIRRRRSGDTETQRKKGNVMREAKTVVILITAKNTKES